MIADVPRWFRMIPMELSVLLRWSMTTSGLRTRRVPMVLLKKLARRGLRGGLGLRKAHSAFIADCKTNYGYKSYNG